MIDIVNLIDVDAHSGTPLIQQLKNEFTWLIVTGKLLPSDRLPSVRKLSKQLSININTVRSAYQLLERDCLVETRQGVGTIVQQLNISRIVDNATRSRSNTIGVILPGLSNPFYHSFLQGIEEITAHDQTMILVCDAHENPEEAFRFYIKLIAKGVDGIICASLPLAKFVNDAGFGSNIFPLITADWPDEQVNTVQIDLENAAYQAASHLSEHGYKHIALITLAADLSNTLPLHRGYKHALLDAGMPESAELIVRVPGFKMEDGQKAVSQILNLDPKPDAIIAIADMLALGAIKEFKQRGYRIPQDFAIIGVDDISLSGLVEPRLTTVSLPSRQLGTEAMKMLQNMIYGKKLEQDKVVLPTQLVIRESCGCRTTS